MENNCSEMTSNNEIYKVHEKRSLLKPDKIKSIFVCGQCFQSFPRKRNLSRHLLIHENAKKFHCLDCGKNFRLQEHLKVKTLFNIKGMTGFLTHHSIYF